MVQSDRILLTINFYEEQSKTTDWTQLEVYNLTHDISCPFLPGKVQSDCSRQTLTWAQVKQTNRCVGVQDF